MADYTHLSNINVQGYVTSSGQGTLLGSFETMPAASAQNAGQIVLYTGATNSTYTKGKYYKSNGSGWSEYDAGQVSAGVLEGYVPKDGSKVLSTNDYTTPEKNKLAGIATGAQVNVIEKVNVTNASGVTSALPVTNKGVTVDLSTLATKSDVSAIPKFAVTLVDTLPASGNASTIYLKSNGGASGNSYDEYLYYNNAWEKIGSTDVDLTAYAKTEDVNAALAGKQGTITAGTGISKSGDTLSLATSGVTAGSKGSTTQVPVITVDQYGRVTSLSSSNIYPPTTAGTNGQYWKSDGSGTGVWETLDTTPTNGSAKAITSGAVYSAINSTNSNVTALQNTVAGKQDKLTFDSTPTSGSSNPVTSGGVYTAINNKMDKKAIDTTVTSGSSNLITSGAVYTAINSIVPGYTLRISFNITSDWTSMTLGRAGDTESLYGYYGNGAISIIDSSPYSKILTTPSNTDINVFATRNCETNHSFSNQKYISNSYSLLNIFPQSDSNYTNFNMFENGMINVQSNYPGAIILSCDISCWSSLPTNSTHYYALHKTTIEMKVISNGDGTCTVSSNTSGSNYPRIYYATSKTGNFRVAIKVTNARLA